MYMMAKHLHMTAVGIRVLLFVFRFIYGQMNPSFLQKKWLYYLYGLFIFK